MNVFRSIGQVVASLAIGSAIVLANPAQARVPVGTAFTYQGQVKSGGNNLNATADFQFKLYDVSAGGVPIAAVFPVNNVSVVNGVFTVQIDFGLSAFGNDARWLEIDVRSPAGGGAFTTLTPRQAVTPAPVAQFALSAHGPNLTNLNASNLTTGTLPSATLTGTYTGSVSFTNAANAFSGSGAGLTALNAGNISTGILPIARGGTGAGTAPAALTSLNAQQRVTGTAPVGSYIRVINADGTVVTGVDANSGGTVSSVGTGAGLTGGPIIGSGTISVAANGITNTMLASDNASLNKVTGGAATVGTTGGLVWSFSPPTNNINPVATFRTTGATTSSGTIRLENTAGDFFSLGTTTGSAFGLNFNANASQSSDLMRVTGTGNFGFGTLSPSAKLHAAGTTTLARLDMNGTGNTRALVINSDGSGPAVEITVPSPATGSGLYSATYGAGRSATFESHQVNNTATVFAYKNGGPVMQLSRGFSGGSVDPDSVLSVLGGNDSELGGGGFITIGSTTSTNISIDNNEIMARNNGSGTTLFLNHGGGNVNIGQGSGGTTRLLTPVLQITGGADLSEQFEICNRNAEPTPGMVVVIDPDKAGHLMPSSSAYDCKVAGIISGANGVNTGMLMGQEGTLADGKYPVALTGRVYCLVDATDHAIAPGDMLTTSATLGHAMKAVDRDRANGAVIGKAMTSLAKGEKGLVMVLVNLQ